MLIFFWRTSAATKQETQELPRPKLGCHSSTRSATPFENGSDDNKEDETKRNKTSKISRWFESQPRA
jgi:hypothetical protein